MGNVFYIAHCLQSSPVISGLDCGQWVRGVREAAGGSSSCGSR